MRPASAGFFDFLFGTPDQAAEKARTAAPQPEAGAASSEARSSPLPPIGYARSTGHCVRLCDGYYFPVSFSTLPNHFQRDAQQCQSQCAAPAELYYHQNPGGAVEQALSASAQQPYTSLKSAFRYRKEFVPGCSCKQAEYKQSTDKKADLQPNTSATPNVRLGATK